MEANVVIQSLPCHRRPEFGIHISYQETEQENYRSADADLLG